MTETIVRSAHSIAVRACLGLLIAFFLTGCQEDLGQSKAASASAGEVSDKRLNGAISSFQETLGQEPDPTSDRSVASGAPADRPTLKWQPPVSREDGSRLLAGDIQEYRIYYRLRHQEAFKQVSQPADEGTVFPLETFKPGAYEFSVTAVDTEGRESRRSDGVSVDLI